jgi:hypothetical protein
MIDQIGVTLGGTFGRQCTGTFRTPITFNAHIRAEEQISGTNRIQTAAETAPNPTDSISAKLDLWVVYC